MNTLTAKNAGMSWTCFGCMGEMIMITKSKYCEFRQCPKLAWLQKYKPELIIPDDNVRLRMENGREVGELAKGLFGEYTDVTVTKDGCPDIPEMIWRTKKELERGTPVICEASFKYDGAYCAVDILKKETGGWAIAEVKSSTENDKEVYYTDVAYQKYVLEHCGVRVTGCYLITVNSDYVFDGTLNPASFFSITDISDEIEQEIALVPETLLLAERILSSKEEPVIDLSEGCQKPYPCGFWKYCTRELPEPSVFDLYRLPFKKKLEYYQRGKVRYEELLTDPSMKNEKRIRQMEYYLRDKGTYADQKHLQEFLETLSFPLYFLDFETMQPVIPKYIGTRPYQQIPFQYSLHYIESEGGELKHKEFLAEVGTDPRRALAEQLCKDIPKDVCVTAYNKKFECGRIRELAEAFPDLSEHLLNIESNIRDLLDPFQKGWYYNKAMGGSFSIKSVLPALFPDDPELDYHSLDGVHNGSEAMTIFPAIENMTPKEQDKARRNLLAYCKLDTLAMVKVWRKMSQ